MKNSPGFTLIEVMAALVIAALATVVLLQAGFTGAAENQATMRYDQALSRAQSRLASFGTLTPIQAETLSGDDGGGYRWRIKMTRIAGNGQIGLFVLELTETFGSRQVELQTERLAVQR